MARHFLPDVFGRGSGSDMFSSLQRDIDRVFQDFGRGGMPSLGGYCASKAAVIAYLESLRLELRATGVKVVTIAPGYIRTPMTAPNRYPMPFLMSAEAFAARAVDAIERARPFAVVPWQMGWVARVLRVLPAPLFDAAFARAPRKPRPPGS